MQENEQLTIENATSGNSLATSKIEITKIPTIQMQENFTMADFETEINRSFHRFLEGDLVPCTVIGINETEVLVDLGSYTEGSIPADEISNDPRFSIRKDITIGEKITCMVISEDNGTGSIVLSKKKADDILVWDELDILLDEKVILTALLTEVVTGGIVTYVKGIRGFIPASQLTMSYVENLEPWLNKKVQAIIITVDKDKKRLILSAKEVEKILTEKDRRSKLSKVQKGIVTNGTVEKLMPFGAFVKLEDGLSGLVHISQICGKHIKSPTEILKEGQEVTVKILDVKDGKISLSIKAVEDNEEILDSVDEVSEEYISEGSVSTGLGDLLKGFKIN